MTDTDPRTRLMPTFWIAVAGIAAILIVFITTVLVFGDASDPGELIPAVLGSVTGAIGTLAGLVAGHTAGAAGKEAAEKRAEVNATDASAGRLLASTMIGEAEAA